LTLRNGTIAGVNPGAFQSVIDAVDGGLPLADDPVRAAFDKEFSNGDLDFKQVDAVLSIASGTIRARNMSLDAATARATGSATLDLNDFSFESDWTIGIASEHQNVIGAEPQVVMRFEGALADPTRSVDTAPFMSYLTLRAYEQEVDRVEALQAEILERDRLTRELRRLRQQKARREEEARRERLAEEARRAQEAAREAARRKREENERRLRDAVEGAIEAPPEQQPALTPAPRSSRSQDRRPAIEPLQPSGGLAPLPDAIDIGPPPTPGGQGSLTETVPFAPADPSAGPPATGQPLQLQPAAPPQTVQQQGAAPQPQRRQRIINAPGDRVIIMPEFDPTKQRYIESTGGRLIRVPN